MIARLVRQIRLPWAPLIIAPLLLWIIPLASGEALFWGTPALQFVPWQVTAWAQFRQGIIPLWNPLNGMGTPLLANYQLAWFYPPTWLVWPFAEWGGAPWVAWADTLLVMLHTIWAGIGMAMLLRRLGVDPLGQTIAGLAFSLSGYFVARAGFFSMIWAGAWLPWVIYSASAIAAPGKVIQNTSTRLIPYSLILTLTMQLLAGHAQFTWYTILLAAAWLLVGGWQKSGWRGSLVALARLAVAGIIAAVLSAIQLLPTAEYLLLSQRSTAYNAEMAFTYSFWPWRLLTLLAPNFFGSPAQGDYWGYASYWEDAVYIGIVPLFLAFSSLLRRKRPEQESIPTVLKWFLWIVALVGFIFALGNNTPIYLWLYHHITTFDMFQAPARWMLWVVFALCVLAGLGAHQWRRLSGRQVKRLRRILVGLFAVVLGAVVAWIFIPQIEPTFIKSTALAGLWALGAGVLLLVMGRMRRSAWELALITWVSLDLLVAGCSFNPTTSIRFYASDAKHPPVTASYVTGNRSYLDPDLEYLLKFSRFLRFGDFRPIEDWSHMRQAGLPNLNLLDGTSSANNFDPLVSARYSRWMAALSDADGLSRSQALANMGVTSETYYDTHSQSGLSQLRIPEAARIYWRTCLASASEEEAAWNLVWQQLSDPSPDCVVVEGVEGHSPPSQKAQVIPAQMAILSESPTSLLISVNSPENGWLVLADLWYPYWHVYVDDQPAQLWRADYLFRGVSVPSGSHTVRFVYRPLMFYIGAAISLAGWLALSAIAIIKLRRHSPDKPVMEK